MAATTILYSLVGLMLALLLFIIASIGRLFRIFLKYYLAYKYGHPIEFATARDAFFMIERKNNRYEILGIILLKGLVDVKKFQENINKVWLQPREIDGRWTHIKLRQCLHQECGYFFWTMKRNFQMDDHFYFDQKTVIKTKDDFHRFLGEETSTPLLRDRPLWQFRIIHLPQLEFPDLEPGSYSYVSYKFHHGIADGFATVRMLNGALFDGDSNEIPPSYKKAPKLSLSTRLYNVADLIFRGSSFVKDIFIRDNNILTTSSLTGISLVGISPPISVARIKKVKNLTSTTVNDVLLSCVAGALRTYFIDKEGKIPSRVQFCIPINLANLSTSAKFENNTTASNVTFPIHETTPLKRLMATKQRMDAIKTAPNIFYFYYAVVGCTNFVPSFLMSEILNVAKMSGLFTNIPGPQRTVTVAGCPVVRTNVLAANGLENGIALSAMTMKDAAQYNFKVDSSIMKTQEEVDNFITNVYKEFEDLEQEIST